MKKFIINTFLLGIILILVTGCMTVNNKPVIVPNPNFATAYNINDLKPDFLKAVTVVDPKDGAIALNAENIDESDVNMSLIGEYEVIFAVTNSLGIEAKYTMKINVLDLEKPILSGLSSDMQLNVGSTLPDWLEGLTASDNNDGVIDINQVQVDSSALNTDVIGTYPVKYKVTDSVGNVSEYVINVQVIDNLKPVIIGLKKNYILEIGSPEPIWLNGVTIEDNYDHFIDVSEITINKNNLNLNGIGDYYLTCTVEDQSGNIATETISVQVVRPSADKELKQRLTTYDEWLQTLENYKISTTQDFTVYHTGYSEKTNLKIDTFVDNQNLYFESMIYQNNSQIGTSIIKPYGNQVLEYLVNGNNVTTNYICEMSEYALKYPSDATLASGLNQNYNLTYTRVSDDQYKITGSVSALNIGAFAEIMKVFEKYPKSNNATFEINITFDKFTKSYEFILIIKDYYFSSYFGVNHVELNFTYTVSQLDLYYHKFNLNNQLLHFNLPNSMETVYSFTDISTPIITTETPHPHYFKAHFETGDYSINTKSISRNNVTIYNLNKQKIDTGLFWSHGAFKMIEGDYFIKVDYSQATSGYELNIAKLNYNTYFDFENPYNLMTTTSGTLEGKTDIDIYNVNVEANCILELEHTPGLLIFTVIGKEVKLCGSYYENGKLYLPLTEGNNILAIRSDILGNYELIAKIIYDNEPTPDIVFEMDEVTSEFSSKSYASGLNLKPDKLRLEITEEGTYEIVYNNILGYTGNLIPDLYDQDHNLLDTTSSMYLVPGTYYIVFGNAFLFKIYNVKYVFYPNETKVFLQTLSQSSLDRFNEFPTFSGTLRAQKSIDIHEFILTEPTCVAIANSLDI